MSSKSKNGRQSSAPSLPPGLKSGKQCYCNGERQLGTLELYCNGCGRWYHSKCLKTIKDFNALAYMVCYTFTCYNCCKEKPKQESWMPRQANFAHMCITAIANLTQKRIDEGSDERKFSLNKVVIPYMEEMWGFLTSMPRRIKSTWHQTLNRTMAKETDIFCSENQDDVDVPGGVDTFFGLVEQDLSKLGPNWDILKTLNKKSSSTADKEKEKEKDKDDIEIEGPKTRGAKRKAENQVTNNPKKTKGSDSTLTKVSGFAYPVDHPFNRDGYRYFLAEEDVNAPNWTEWNEREETAGKPIPAYLYRIVHPSIVELSSHDRAPILKLGDDHLTVCGEKGYSVVRGTHGVNKGSWYYEVQFLEQLELSHVRLGWSLSLGCLQAPVGYDRFSYAWRSRKGTRFHDSRGKHYAEKGYRAGDTIGCLITLPQDPHNLLPPSHKDLPLIKFKSHFYYEEKDELPKALKALRPLKGGEITFFKNGISQGVAFMDINAGTYYPALSLYKTATVRANFGPKFKYPPKEVSYKPMCERAEETTVEQALSDILFFAERGDNLELDQTSS